jgi:hypothetical protein
VIVLSLWVVEDHPLTSVLFVVVAVAVVAAELVGVRWR